MGLILANFSFDVVLNGHFFGVAHFHYVLRRGAVFALKGGLLNWFPIISGLTINNQWLKA